VERNSIAISLARERDQISLVQLRSIATDFRTGFAGVVEASIVASNGGKRPHGSAQRGIRRPEWKQIDVQVLEPARPGRHSLLSHGRQN